MLLQKHVFAKVHIRGNFSANDNPSQPKFHTKYLRSTLIVSSKFHKIDLNVSLFKASYKIFSKIFYRSTAFEMSIIHLFIIQWVTKYNIVASMGGRLFRGNTSLRVFYRSTESALATLPRPFRLVESPSALVHLSSGRFGVGFSFGIPRSPRLSSSINERERGRSRGIM